jgi:hypothetical protein
VHEDCVVLPLFYVHLQEHLLLLALELSQHSVSNVRLQLLLVVLVEVLGLVELVANLKDDPDEKSLSLDKLTSKIP